GSDVCSSDLARLENDCDCLSGTSPPRAPPRSSRYNDHVARTAKPQRPPDERPNPAPERPAPSKANACPPDDCSPDNDGVSDRPGLAPVPSNCVRPVASAKVASSPNWLPAAGEAAPRPASIPAALIPTESGAWPGAPAVTAVPAFDLT